MRATFGAREPGRVYVPRPSVYVVARSPSGAVAVVASHDGVFLPGGGVEPGETWEAAVRREVREECGAEIVLGPRIAEATQYAHSLLEHAYYEKLCVFFSGVMGPPSAELADPGHELLWLMPDEAAARLAHESHAWAVRLFVGG
jgi:8-oxo-dGTP diphosphatase